MAKLFAGKWKVFEIVVFLVVLVHLTVHHVDASNHLAMEIKPGSTRCVGQELDQEDAATFTVVATLKEKEKNKKYVNPFDREQIHVTVSDPNEKALVDEDIGVGAPARDIRMNVETNGVHNICFERGSGDKPMRVVFNIESKTRTNRNGADPSKKIGKEDVPTLENELKAAEGALQEISREIDFARRQEVLLRQAGEATSSRIQWFSIFSMIILLATSIWQIIYLRSFFASKKLL